MLQHLSPILCSSLCVYCYAENERCDWLLPADADVGNQKLDPG